MHMFVCEFSPMMVNGKDEVTWEKSWMTLKIIWKWRLCEMVRGMIDWEVMKCAEIICLTLALTGPASGSTNCLWEPGGPHPYKIIQLEHLHFLCPTRPMRSYDSYGWQVFVFIFPLSIYIKTSKRWFSISSTSQRKNTSNSCTHNNSKFYTYLTFCLSNFFFASQ